MKPTRATCCIRLCDCGLFNSKFSAISFSFSIRVESVCVCFVVGRWCFVCFRFLYHYVLSLSLSRAADSDVLISLLFSLQPSFRRSYSDSVRFIPSTSFLFHFRLFALHSFSSHSFACGSIVLTTWQKMSNLFWHQNVQLMLFICLCHCVDCDWRRRRRRWSVWLNPVDSRLYKHLFYSDWIARAGTGISIVAIANQLHFIVSNFNGLAFAFDQMPSIN